MGTSMDPGDATSVPETIEDWYDDVTTVTPSSNDPRRSTTNEYATLRRRLSMRQQSMRQQSPHQQQSFTSSQSFASSLHSSTASSRGSTPSGGGSSFVSAIPGFASSTSDTAAAPKLYQVGSIKECAEEEGEEAEGEAPAHAREASGGSGADGGNRGTARGETNGQEALKGESGGGTAPGRGSEGEDQASNGRRMGRAKLGRVSFAAGTWHVGVDDDNEEDKNEDVAQHNDYSGGSSTSNNVALGGGRMRASFGPPGASGDSEDDNEPAASSAFYNELLGIGEAPLINLIRRYHEALQAHGLDGEARQIAASAAARLVSIKSMARGGEEDGEDGEVEGEGGGSGSGGWFAGVGGGMMGRGEAGGGVGVESHEDAMRSEVVVREGLQRYLIAMQPHLLCAQPQVVAFSHVAVTRKVEVIPDQIKNCLNAPYFKLKSITGWQKKETVQVLNDVSGFLMPGTLTLLLGTSGSGKTTLIRLLSGRQPPTAGSVTFNALPVTPSRAHRLAGVGFEADCHLPALSVHETLSFARQCSFPLSVQQLLQHPMLGKALRASIERGDDPLVASREAMFGLTRRAQVKVGSGRLSRDEVHRLTAAELMVGAYPVLLFDRISQVYDGPSTHKTLTMLRTHAQVRQHAVLCSLQWPTQAVFSLFDRVIVLNQGQIVFQGPCHAALRHFQALGYLKPLHMSVPEYLQHVTTEGGGALRSGKKKLLLDGFVRAYKKSPYYKNILRVTSSPAPLLLLWISGPARHVLSRVRCALADVAPDALSTLDGGESNGEEQKNTAAESKGEATPHPYQAVVVTEARVFFEGAGGGGHLKEGVEATGPVCVGDVVVAVTVGERGEMEYASYAGGEVPGDELMGMLEELRDSSAWLHLELQRPLTIVTQASDTTQEPTSKDTTTQGTATEAAASTDATKQDSEQLLPRAQPADDLDLDLEAGLPQAPTAARPTPTTAAGLGSSTQGNGMGSPAVAGHDNADESRAPLVDCTAGLLACSSLSGSGPNGGGSGPGGDDVGGERGAAASSSKSSRPALRIQSLPRAIPRGISSAFKTLSFAALRGRSSFSSKAFLQLPGMGVEALKAMNLSAAAAASRAAAMAGLWGGANRELLSKELILEPWPEFKLLLQRQLRVNLRNRSFIAARLLLVTLLGLFVGFDFFQLPADPPSFAHLNLRRGVMQISLITMTVNNVSLLPGYMLERQVYFKHRSARFFRTRSYVLAQLIASLPLSIVEGAAAADWVGDGGVTDPYSTRVSVSDCQFSGLVANWGVDGSFFHDDELCIPRHADALVPKCIVRVSAPVPRPTAEQVIREPGVGDFHPLGPVADPRGREGEAQAKG
ncbi:hypothetical protein CLOP_g15782 [Closterium sp. NIES-67]|nr:hypothetical protein CLOP_g15782 [Closterium sp. NIES-67]